MVALDMDGEYKFESDFVFDAGNVASTTAEAICSLYAEQHRSNRSKGL